MNSSIKAEEIKACPFGSSLKYCKKERCALWNPQLQKCALQQIAMNLEWIEKQLEALTRVIKKSAQELCSINKSA